MSVGCVEADADYGEVFRGRVMGVYEDTADFGVGFAARVGGVEGVFCCRGFCLLVMIRLGLSLGVDGVCGRGGGRGMRRILRTYVVRPFELDG